MKTSDLTKLINDLRESTNAERNSEAFQSYMKYISRFHHYSFSNAMLIMLQFQQKHGVEAMPGHVAGYMTWKKMNRTPLPNTALRIIAPCKSVRIERDEHGNEVRKPSLYFKTVCVFAAEDTVSLDGSPLPSWDVNVYSDEKIAILPHLVEIAKSENIEVRFVKGLEAYGTCTSSEICLRAGMNDADTLNSLSHELGHYYLHFKEKTDVPQSRSVREFEAECFSYMFASHWNIPTTAAKYLAVWSDVKTPWDNAERVHKSVMQVISKVRERLGINNEQEITGE